MVAPGEIVYREVPIPEITEQQVLIKVARIGICGSDMHVYHGKHPYTSYPVVQGHEVSGFVERVGAAVTSVAVGDLVTFLPQITCGECGPCLRGQPHICDHLRVMGFQAEGAAAEYVAIDQQKVLRLPSSVKPDIGALVEPLAVAVHAARRAGNLAGNRALVLGAGPIGILVAQVAQSLGARVVISDPSSHRRQIAEQCGILKLLTPMPAISRNGY